MGQLKEIKDFPATIAESPSHAQAAAGLKRTLASRLFGYDVFLSFALGPPPRGAHSYASDLARRLRERDFNVFFSEEEAPPGDQLDSTLRNALLRSKILVVIANRGTLQEPRWVRKEVEEFREQCSNRPVVAINVGGALQEPTLRRSAQEWLGFEGKIWLDETEEAVADGIATERIVERLATAPRRARANVKWRWLTRGAVASLTALAIGLGVVTKIATDSAERARAELKRATALRLISEGSEMLSGTRSGGDERAMLQALAAHRLGPGPAANGSLLNALLRHKGLLKLVPNGTQVIAVAFSPDGSRLATGGWDSTLRWWDSDTGKSLGAPLRGHTHWVWSVAFSPDGSRLASGSADRTVRLWDVDSGEPSVIVKVTVASMG